MLIYPLFFDSSHTIFTKVVTSDLRHNSDENILIINALFEIFAWDAYVRLKDNKVFHGKNIWFSDPHNTTALDQIDASSRRQKEQLPTSPIVIVSAT